MPRIDVCIKRHLIYAFQNNELRERDRENKHDDTQHKLSLYLIICSTSKKLPCRLQTKQKYHSKQPKNLKSMSPSPKTKQKSEAFGISIKRSFKN